MAAETGVKRKHAALAEALCGPALRERLQSLYDELRTREGRNMVGRMGRMVMCAPLFLGGAAVFMAIGGFVVLSPVNGCCRRCSAGT
jgi:hypothetical protein